MMKFRPAGLLVKISGTGSLFVLLAILILAFMSIYRIRAMSLETAVIMGQDKLQGDMATMEYILTREYGQIRLEGGELVNEQGYPITYNHRAVDTVSDDLGIVATIFVKDGNDFRRISTSITDTQRNRVVDTLLGTGSAAYPYVSGGREYLGNAVILGNEYLTAYRPFFAPDSRDVIGILFIGIEMSSISEFIDEHTAKETITIAIVASVILILSIMLNVLSSNLMVLRPIRTAVEMLKEISQGEGDLTKQLTISSKDEIAEMARYFNLTLEKIKSLVLTIKKESASLFEIGNDLSNNMNKTAAAINEITANIQNIKGRVTNQSASVNEASSTMEQITINIDQLNSHVENQTAAVVKSSSAIEEMLANIQSVTQTLVKNSKNVTELSTASETGRTGLQDVAQDIQAISKESEGLLEINAVMENIASQTNLLSMNAAIEAAHAGEAGKGFAVVADEIRKLAENSSEQSKTISTVLKNIKGSIDKIIASTDSVLSRFQAIDKSVRTVADQEENILNAMEEQGEGSKQILEAISHLNEITAQVKDGSEKMLEGSKEVINESKNLETVTEEISGGMNEMAAGADQINASVDHVNGLTGKNSESIDVLVQAVSRFKVE